MSIQVPYQALSNASAGDVKREFEAAVTDLVTQLKNFQFPENDNDIELRSSEIAVQISGVNRR